MPIRPATPSDIDSIGREMLDEVSRFAHRQGAVQTVVVTGHYDKAKRMLLKQAGLTIDRSGIP